MSGSLDHVNVWLLEGPDGWTIVDCGTDTAAVREAWGEIRRTVLSGRPVRRLVGTHGHTDHIGHAGPLGRSLDLPIIMPRCEWLMASWRRASAHMPVEDDPSWTFFRRHGCGPDTTQFIEEGRRHWRESVAELPPLRAIRDGDTLDLAGRRWRVIVTGGHAPEHAALWCERDRILIAGDHLLPSSTPTLSITWNEPDADPLGEFLAGLNVFDALPEDCLVLPSHGRPYKGITRRSGELRAYYERRLRQVAAAADSGATAYAIACQIFAKAMGDGRGRLAFNLTVACLNRLTAAGVLIQENAGRDVVRFRPAAEGAAHGGTTVSERTPCAGAAGCGQGVRSGQAPDGCPAGGNLATG